MDSQQIRDAFLEALAELSPTGEGGLFPHVVNQLTSIDPATLIEGALEALAVLGGAWAADHGVTVQLAARHFLDGLQATE
jgi:hypothetical protein